MDSQNHTEGCGLEPGPQRMAGVKRVPRQREEVGMQDGGPSFLGGSYKQRSKKKPPRETVQNGKKEGQIENAQKHQRFSDKVKK